MATVPQKLAKRFGCRPEDFIKRDGKNENNRPVSGWFFQRQLNWRDDACVEYYIGPSLYEIQHSPLWAQRQLGSQRALDCWLLPRHIDNDAENVSGYFIGKEYLWQVWDAPYREQLVAYQSGILNPTQVLAGDTLTELIQAIQRMESMPFPEACCEKAELIPCVCQLSYKCPEHYPEGYHVGTHD